MGYILLIDDDDSLRLTFRAVLEMKDYEVIEAASSREAYDACSKNRIAVVITDLGLPDKDGLEMIAKLRKTYPDMKIIASSGTNKELLDKSIEAGADCVFPKPVEHEKLFEKLDEYLKK